MRQRLSRVVLVIACLLVAATTFAQGLDVRFYFVPKVGTGVKGNEFRPKYANNEAATGPFDWTGMDYGAEDTILLAAIVSPAQHNALAAQADVLAIPAPIDDPVGGAALSTVQNKLEGLNIPGGWVTTAHTYRDVLRLGGKMMLILQRYNEIFGTTKLFAGGVTLSTQWNQLTAPQKSRLQTVATSFNLDTSGVTNLMTIRQILKAVADQLPSFALLGETF